MKKLVYTIICFKCIMQITQGSAYQNYIKLFSQLLILCMCCGMLISFIGDVGRVYEGWKTQWEKITSVTLDENEIRSGSEYYEEKLMEALEEYETDAGETGEVN